MVSEGSGSVLSNESSSLLPAWVFSQEHAWRQGHALAACRGKQKMRAALAASTLQVPAPAQRLATQTEWGSCSHWRLPCGAEKRAWDRRAAGRSSRDGSDGQKGHKNKRQRSCVCRTWLPCRRGARPVGLGHTPAAAGAPACTTQGPPTAAAATAGTGACWQWEPAQQQAEGRGRVVRS